MPEYRPTYTAGMAYDLLANAYASVVDTKPHNAFYERPATLSLLPDVQGQRVVDAGCGAGTYTKWLVSQEAEVVAFDASAEMVRLTQEQVGDTARVFHANLGEPLAFLDSETFDLVLSPLALDFVEDWQATFTEFRRILRPHGCFVFSVNHPLHDYLDFQATNYFQTESVVVKYGSLGGVDVPTFRRPLSAIFAPLLDSGFSIERFLEPLPTKEFLEQDPKGYAKLMQCPMFLCIRARKL